MTNTSTTAAVPRRSAGQWMIVAVLGILGILAFVVAILYITGTANHIHFLSGTIHHGVHDIRLAVCIVAGLLLLAGAGYFARSSSKT
jgi:nicotinamide riboside transporter PnuC